MTIYKPNGDIIIDAPVTTAALEKYELMVDHYIQLPFEHTEALDIPVGSFVRHNDVAFFTMRIIRPERLRNKDGYKYDIKFYAPQHRMQRRVLAWLSASRKETTFNLTTTITAFAQLVVDNMNEQDEVYNWQLGDIPSNEESKKIEFNGLSCWDAVGEIAKAFECEWWVEMTKGTYPTLCFGKLAKGEYDEWREGEVVTSFPAFKGDDSAYGTRFFIFGGTRNIPSDYYESAIGGTTNHISEKRLHLPDGIEYIDARQDLTEGEIIEKVVNFDEIFPKNEDAVTSVRTREATVVEGETNDVYIIGCADSPFIPTDDTIVEQHIYAKFTSGSLEGREFELTGYENGTSFAYEYELMAQTESSGDGDVIVIPNEYLHPKVGDTFILTGVVLPKERISAAEQELLAKGQEYVVEHSNDTNVYDCPTNPVYCELNAKDYTVGQKVTLIGGIFGDAGRASRIQGYEKKLWNPYEATYSVGDNRRYTRYGAFSKDLNNITHAVVTPLKAVTESTNYQAGRIVQYTQKVSATATEAQRMSSEAKADSATAIEQASKASQSSTALSNQVTLLATRVGSTETDIEDIDERVSALETSGGGGGDGTSDANKLDKPSTQPNPRNVMIWDSTNNTVQGSGRELTEDGLLQIQGFKDDSGHKYALPQSGLSTTDYDEMLATQEWVDYMYGGKQDALTPSYAISISSDNTISLKFSSAFFSVDASNALMLSSTIQEAIGSGVEGYKIAQKSIHALDDMLNIKPSLRLYMPASGALSAAHIYAYHPYIQLVDSTAQLIVMRYNSKKNSRLDGQSHYKTSGGWSECQGTVIGESGTEVSPLARGTMVLQNGWQLYQPILDAICARAMLAKGLIDGYDEISMGQAMTLKDSDSALDILRELYYGTFAPEKLFGQGHNRIKLGVALRVKNPAFYERYPDIDSATDSSAKRMWADNTPRYLYSNVAEIILSAGSHAVRFPKLALKG